MQVKNNLVVNTLVTNTNKDCKRVISIKQTLARALN